MDILELLYAELDKSLSDEPLHLTAGGRQINVRCRFCGDSHKSSRHAHFFIGVSKTHNLLSYYCQRCNSEGVVNNTLLNMYDVHSITLKSNIINYNKEFFKKNFNLTKDDSYVQKYQNYMFDNPDVKQYYRNKTEYLRNRFGKDFDKNFSELGAYKIIYSLNDFLFQNNIDLTKTYSVSKLKYLLPLLEVDYVGFLSNSGCSITFRSINPDNRMRYYKLALHETIQTDFYSLPNRLDTSKQVNLNLCEGTFDIIGLQRRGFVKDSDVNVAVLNKDYINKVVEIIKRVGSIHNIKSINIYSDTEIGKKFYKKQFSRLPYIFNSKVKIFYNTEGKDYGDISDKIVLRSV